MPARLSRVYDDDTLVPMGGAWPQDAYFVRNMSSGSLLLNPTSYSSHANSIYAANTPQGLRGWRRVVPELVWRRVAAPIDLPPVYVEVHEVRGEGAVAFVGDADVYAGSLDEALDIAKRLASFELPDLDRWTHDEPSDTYFIETPVGELEITLSGRRDWRLTRQGDEVVVVAATPGEALEKARDFIASFKPGR